MDVFSCNTIVVGSGVAGLNAADRLYEFGQHDIAIVTEGLEMGTSRNTGSDKQTYYKLTLAGSETDSVLDMARTLFDGGCMHGDLALCEAALSVRCFCRLADIGVPFPHNRYGEYIGYKTDHDPRQRATSAGPLTSRYMTEKLEIQVKAKNIRIFDGYKAVGIITDQGVCMGLLALKKAALTDTNINNGTCRVSDLFVVFNCTNVVLATGGPAGLYRCSVFPISQTGSNGIAFEAGAAGRNLTEWQYGIASIKFRWNLSGSYQQVIPRYISTDQQGNDAREFLDPFFPDARQMLDAIFLKGYQWPFDSRKIVHYGSSLIDILVHREIHQKGRRVFLDFLHNPTLLKDDFSNLGKESYTYLEQSRAFQPTPLERLAHINRPAIDLYKNNGIDLSCEMLEIAVCAQHNNGGLAVNSWWETTVPHLFAVGEAAGTHGVYRPGGSALNAGQAGSTRAAMFIARRYVSQPMPETDFMQLATPQINMKMELAQKLLTNKTGLSPREIRTILGNRMSAYAAHIRHPKDISRVKDEAAAQLQHITEQTVLSSPVDLVTAFENVDLLISQYVYASAIEDYIDAGGGSRGSCIISDPKGKNNILGFSKSIPDEGESGIQDQLKFASDDGKLSSKIQEVRYFTPENHFICHNERLSEYTQQDLSLPRCEFVWDNVRPIPRDDYWFENVWREYRDDIAGL
ncbi:MAG: FAD-binding protein [Tannerella sp.]|jgi:succinate dehydrogenase/fumarate reductase flavoprotein subunit|nr:FAD-binding protein [Tannerella sp.]